jgi:rhodanese-related sulfurtransferase
MLEAVKEGESRTIPIQVTSAEYPLTISWDLKSQPITATLMIGNREVAMNGTGSVTVTDPKATIALKLGGQQLLPKEFELLQNYPNPFNPSTVIRYELPHGSKVALTVYNTQGRRVAILAQGYQEGGYHEVRFDGGNLAGGVYFYRLKAGDFEEMKKLVFLH